VETTADNPPLTAEAASQALPPRQLNVLQGEIYWIHPGDPTGAYAGFRQPHVILQNNIFNHSHLETVICCALSTNLKRADIPGNVLLEPGEGGLLHQSVVVVSSLCSVEKSNLGEYIGSLAPERLAHILEGVCLLLEPTE
jgi:mRNA interferase MazF